MAEPFIQYLTNREIDREKWDKCVASATNSLIYNSSIYLDMLADDWNAIVVDDYRAIMPLPWRKKFLFKYYYHVPFVPQSGITGEYENTIFPKLSKEIFRRIRFGDLLLNYDNVEYASYLRARKMTNMVLDLSLDMPHLHKVYHRDLDKNLRKSARYELQYIAEPDIKLGVSLFKKLYGSRFPSVNTVHYERFAALCLYLQRIQQAFARKVTDRKGRLLAVGIFFKDHRRIYNIMNSVPPEGRRRSANHFLFDQLLREFAGSGLTLDFEGSQLPGIRKFYENFGAVNEPFFWVRRVPLGLG